MSATATKQKKTFKESAKETGQKVKSYAKKQTDKVKSSAKRYGSDIRTAYDMGYARGWDDAYDIPPSVLVLKPQRLTDTKKVSRIAISRISTRNSMPEKAKKTNLRRIVYEQ